MTNYYKQAISLQKFRTEPIVKVLYEQTKSWLQTLKSQVGIWKQLSELSEWDGRHRISSSEPLNSAEE